MEAITEVERAINDVRGLCDFAYRQGFHEMGYDPVITISESIESYRSLIVSLENEIARLKEERTVFNVGKIEAAPPASIGGLQWHCSLHGLLDGLDGPTCQKCAALA